MIEFRTLRADEIECRISQITAKGVMILLYKDARCDMNILDETLGVDGWKREHSRDNANCTVSIWSDRLNQWISKEDTGKESFTEKEKGLASDSFKRSCVNLGIGRELYTAPFIFFNSNEVKIVTSGGKNKCFDEFVVTSITYDSNRNIKEVVILDTNTKVKKTFKNANYVDKAVAKSENQVIPQGEADAQQPISVDEGNYLLKLIDDIPASTPTADRIKYYLGLVNKADVSDLTKGEYNYLVDLIIKQWSKK